MKIIENITLDESSVGTINAIESAAEYSATGYYEGDATTGDVVQVAADKRRYQAVWGGAAATVTISHASPGVVTHTAHGLAANAVVMLTTTGGLPTGLSVDTVYYVRNPAADTYELSATSGGASINTSSDGSGTHTAHPTPNRGNTPGTDDGTNWIDIGPTNPGAMFDEYSETQTERADNITAEINPSGRVTALAFFNLDAELIRVEVEDAVEGSVYDEEFNLTSYDNIDDFYDYFFAPLIRKTDLYVDGLPPYAGATLTLTITNDGGTAKCGKVIVGEDREIGETIAGADFGIIDASRITEDDFGNLTIIERSFRKRMSLNVKVARENVDETGRLLASRRATPTVFVGSDDYGQLLVDGIPREWRVGVEEYLYSMLNITIEGLR